MKYCNNCLYPEIAVNLTNDGGLAVHVLFQLF